MNKYNMGWLVGWLEGKGHFRLTNNQAYIVGVSAEIDVLRRVAVLLGKSGLHQAGKPVKQHYKRLFAVKIGGRKALTLMKKLRPLMGQRRQQQIDAVLAQHTPTRHQLEEKAFLKILKLLADGLMPKIIAPRFKISRSYVSHLAAGRFPKRFQLAAKRFAKTRNRAKTNRGAC